jgi:hypothetical protein
MENPFGKRDNSYVSYLTIKENGVQSYGYLTIKGIIKNQGIRKVTQCCIEIKIYDQNDDVISTDKFYVLGDIVPGRARTFHSMTNWPKSAKAYNLAIDAVKVKQ